MEKFAFYDICPIEQNSAGGIFYVAAGLVESIESVEPVPSGKEIVVVYIDPRGEFQREWRAHADINMYKISEFEYEQAMFTIVERE